MREVLRRRLQRAADGDEKFLPLPDVFLIDGGVTHASRRTGNRGAASACGVPIFGMVKDDRHRTRALVTPEGREIGIVNNQAVFSLIGRIQEETHRFAIAYHHQQPRQKALCALHWTAFPVVGPEAAGGTAEALRHHQGHPGGGRSGAGRRPAPERGSRGLDTSAPGI